MGVGGVVRQDIDREELTPLWQTDNDKINVFFLKKIYFLYKNCINFLYPKKVLEINPEESTSHLT